LRASHGFWSTYDLLVRLLAEEFGVPRERISPDVTFEGMEFGSLAEVEVATMLEDQPGVRLPENRTDVTLGEAAAFLELAAGLYGARAVLAEAVQ
jgi:acyl carrier protein